jgi:hypothetical protein
MFKAVLKTSLVCLVAMIAFIAFSSRYDTTKPQTATSTTTSGSSPNTTQPRVSSEVPPTASTSPSTTVTADQSTSNVTNNWAGYGASGSFSGISGSWTVPQVSTAGETAADATWIGIGGVTTTDLIQTGTLDTVDADGQTSSSAFYELLPDAPVDITALNVSQGDGITASIGEVATGEWTITLNDTSNGESYTTTVAYSSSQSSAEWIEEDPSGETSEVPLDNFGTVNFSGGSATENGSTVSIAGSGAQAFTMVDATGATLASTSALGSSGTSFSVTRGSASSSAGISELGGDPGSWQRQGRGLDRSGY